MSIQSFLYRRLSRWITCELNLPLKCKISLENKYELASFNDVFCHPFYWQLFQCIEQTPGLIIDCGAHCGHFTILAETCIYTKFKDLNTNYILVEPNPLLIPIIHKNLHKTNILKRANIKQGFVGRKSGSSTLWVNKKNYLTASIKYIPNAKPYTVNYIDLLEVVGDRIVDLMKIDIEGGEFEFIPENLKLFSQTNLVFIEIHSATEEMTQNLYRYLESVGLHIASKPLKNDDHYLVIFQR
ncbi:MAG: FkbM family methyltransferase [Nostoc sp.]|uniref:FkbM family methyltransferase n=1 Tax=Nostoc sp. TaxID=1180 RepID=UPI002FFAE731